MENRLERGKGNKMILISFGTRPEYIKLKPVMDACTQHGKPYKVLYTGQHLDLLPQEAISYVDIHLEIKNGPNRLDSIVASLMNQDMTFFDASRVMVQGDTTSAFAVALAAFHRKIPVIHLEAGLRTYDNDNPYPEEFNRQAISRLAAVHLCPSQMDYNNLITEKVQGSVHVVGNTVLDNLLGVETSYTNKVLITMHRRENHANLDKWFTVFEKIAVNNPELNFQFISHPNPNVQKHLHLLNKVYINKPMVHGDFINFLADCKFLITDSGGLQEESSFLRKKSIVCRHKTERNAGLGTFASLCHHPEDLERLVEDANENYIIPSDLPCPYGDGHAADKIYKILKDLS